VPTAWNRNLKSLRFEPLYPPSEDFDVGDLLVTISDDGLSDDLLANNAVRGLLYRSVRVGKLKLVPDTISRPHFQSKITFLDKGQEDKSDPDCEKMKLTSIKLADPSDPGKPNDIAVVGFPGISFLTDNHEALDLPSIGGSLARQTTRSGTISIHEVATYGADAPRALADLMNYCTDHPTFCTDKATGTYWVQSTGEL